MKDKEKINEEEILKFFEDRVNQSGYTLESSVERILRQWRFSVLREQPYLDKDGSKGRMIDLVARMDIPDEIELKPRGRYALGQLVLVIECKNLPDHGWIFFIGEPFELSVPESVSLTSIMKPDPANSFIPIGIMPELFYASSYQEVIYDSGKRHDPKKSNKKENNLYESVLAVTKATRYAIESSISSFTTIISSFPADIQLSRNLFFDIFQPVIVFKGRMYGAIEIEGKTKLKPIQFAQLPKKYVSQNYNESLGEIHVVSFEHLDDYLKLVRNWHLAKSKDIKDNQDQLLAILDSVKSNIRSTFSNIWK